MRWFWHLARAGRSGIATESPPTWSRRPFVISRRSSSDGRRALEIVRLPDGMYRFIEWIEQPGDEDVFPFLAPMHWSETYDSVGDADEAAHLHIGWLARHDAR